MDYLSTVRVLDTDYKIKDGEAARINHTHKVEEIEGAAKEGHRHQASEIAGLSTVATSGSYSDLNGKPSAATESADGLMTSADKAKLDGIQAGASSYTHPTHTAHESGLYKVAVDSLGHVSSATAVTKSDITALGIPAQDTDTTYTEATTSKAGLMSAADKGRLDGMANVKEWVASRGQNLVTNGYATLGDNTNFSCFSFDGADAYRSGGSFSHRATAASLMSTDELMPYDPSNSYRLSYYIKSDCADARYCDILDCYDIDGNKITDSQVTFVSGSTTTLAADLKPGDTSVSVESAAGFNVSDTDGRQYFNRGLMFWNYADSHGYVYGPETYTRNRHDALWTSNATAIDKAGNRILLDKAWSGPTVPKGTGVSQTGNGATSVYGNVNFTVPAGEWTRKEVTLEGEARPGTAYVKIGWLLPNYMGGASSVTTKLTGVSFGAVPAYANSAAKADRATTASRVADGGAGTANAARHVWFSDSGIETARVHNDAFRYNPVGNMLSCNVSGSAATAESAASAAKLAEARTVSISGAVSGSATWDGSGNVNISTTANESYVSSPISGLFNMSVDADGNLWVYHSDSDKAPNFEYDSATGNLYYVTEA
jgi:hypothetical protein